MNTHSYILCTRYSIFYALIEPIFSIFYNYFSFIFTIYLKDNPYLRASSVDFLFPKTIVKSSFYIEYS